MEHTRSAFSDDDFVTAEAVANNIQAVKALGVVSESAQLNPADFFDMSFVAQATEHELGSSWCGKHKEGWVFPSSIQIGHLTTIAKGFQAARSRAGLDKKLLLVPYSARHTHGTYTMEKSRNTFRQVHGLCRP